MLFVKYLKGLFKHKKGIISVDVLAGYAQWAKNYPAWAHNPLMEIEERAMLSLLPDDLSGQVCLDLACGSGRYMKLMQSRRAQQIFGVDYSADMLAQAVNSALVQSTFLALPFAAAVFDLVVCGLAVGHEKNLRQTLAEISRVLRPGGLLLYSDFHPFGTLSGWRRSFTTTNGDTFQLEHYLHLYSDHLRSCQAASLTIQAVLEPAAGEHAPPESQHIPAVLVIGAVKTKMCLES